MQSCSSKKQVEDVIKRQMKITHCMKNYPTEEEEILQRFEELICHLLKLKER
jgi:hypothetical protein